MAGCALPARDFDEAEWLRRAEGADPALLYAAHVTDDGVFFNPWLSDERRMSRVDWLRFNLSGLERVPAFPEAEYAHVENDYAYLADPGHESISYFGQATFFIKMDGRTIVTDPFFSSLAFIIRKKVYIPFDRACLPEQPVVLISHGHYDHLDASSVRALAGKDAVFVVPVGLGGLLRDFGAQNVRELDWWQSLELGGLRYTLLPAQHGSRRFLQRANSSLWGSFLIEGSRTIYFSGDSGYFIGFEEFGRRYDIDYALLAAGAYLPRWIMHYAHQNVPEFFRAAEKLNARFAIPMHFGVIELAKEPLLHPLHEIRQYLDAHPEYRRRVVPLRVGERLMLE